MESIKSKLELEEIIAKETMALVYFGNLQCGVCLDLKPKVEEMLKTYPEIKSYYVSVDYQLEIAAAYSIFTIPGILVFAEGKEFLREARNISMNLIEEKIDRYYQMVFD